MLHFLTVGAAALPLRSLADGGAGTLGAESVGAHELRRGGVPLDRLAPLDPGRLLGRAAGAGGPGAPEALDAEALRALIGLGAAEPVAASREALEATSPPAGTQSIVALGAFAPGDGGAARWLRVPDEPAHPGKLRTADGAWWTLSGDGPVSPRIFGALGDGASNDTAAFADAIAFCLARRVALAIPAGDWLLDELPALIPDAGPGVPRHSVHVGGAGRDATRLLFSRDLTRPFLEAAPSPTVKLGRLTLSDLTIDGRGFAGTALHLSHMTKCHFQRIVIANVAGIGIDAEELWDSTFLDVMLDGVGDRARALPSLRLSNRDPEDANSSCNNLGFYDLHLENHPHVGLELLDTSRKLAFVRLKGHHTPGAFPPDGTPHVVLDARAVPAGPGNMIAIDCQLAASAGPAILVQNTGGPSDEGFYGVQICGSAGVDRHAVEVRAASGVTIANFATNGSTFAPFRLHDGARVQIDWNTVQCLGVGPGNFPVLFDAGGESATSLRIRDAAVSALGELVTLRAGSGGDDVLDRIAPAQHGQRLLLQAVDPVRVRDAALSGLGAASGGLRLGNGAVRRLASPQARLTLRYDATSEKWVEAAYAPGAAGTAASVTPAGGEAPVDGAARLYVSAGTLSALGGGVEGATVLLMPAEPGAGPLLRDVASAGARPGALLLDGGADVALSGARAAITLAYRADLDRWVEVARSGLG